MGACGCCQRRMAAPPVASHGAAPPVASHDGAARIAPGGAWEVIDHADAPLAPDEDLRDATDLVKATANALGCTIQEVDVTQTPMAGPSAALPPPTVVDHAYLMAIRAWEVEIKAIDNWLQIISISVRARLRQKRLFHCLGFRLQARFQTAATTKPTVNSWAGLVRKMLIRKRAARIWAHLGQFLNHRKLAGCA